jgi:hypothetical protein
VIPVRFLLMGVVAAAVIIGTPVLIKRYNESLREDGRREVREQVRVEAEAQAARNRELQRAAETRYVVQAETRDRYITRTVKEIHEVAAPLADCRVPDAVRMRLSAAAACASGDSAASCDAGGTVPTAR